MLVTRRRRSIPVAHFGENDYFKHRRGGDLGVGKASSRRFLAPRIAFSNSPEPSDFDAGHSGDATCGNLDGGGASAAERLDG